jgi:hypothetical protein
MRPCLRGEMFGDAPALDYVDACVGECLRLSTTNPSIEGRLGRCLTLPSGRPGGRALARGAPPFPLLTSGKQETLPSALAVRPCVSALCEPDGWTAGVAAGDCPRPQRRQPGAQPHRPGEEDGSHGLTPRLQGWRPNSSLSTACPIISLRVRPREQLPPRSCAPAVGLSRPAHARSHL